MQGSKVHFVPLSKWSHPNGVVHDTYPSKGADRGVAEMLTTCKMLCRFRKISQIYSQGIRPLARDSLELQNWNWLYNATDKLTKGWLTHGSRLLQQVCAFFVLYTVSLYFRLALLQALSTCTSCSSSAAATATSIKEAVSLHTDVGDSEYGRLLHPVGIPGVHSLC